MGLFKKLLRIIAIILVIIAIIYFILAVIAYSGPIAASKLGYLALGMSNSIGWGTFALIGFGFVAIASIISPEGTRLALDRIGDGISTVAENVVDVAGNVASSVADNVLKNPIVLIGGLAALWYLSGDSSENEANVREQSLDEGAMYA
jgi:hypothetical protein